MRSKKLFKCAHVFGADDQYVFIPLCELSRAVSVILFRKTKLPERFNSGSAYPVNSQLSGSPRVFLPTLSVDSVENVPSGLPVLELNALTRIQVSSAAPVSGVSVCSRRRCLAETSTEQTGLAQICCIRVAREEIS